MLDSAVSDTAFRLYAILARYGNASGVRMPGRALLARRLRWQSSSAGMRA